MVSQLQASSIFSHNHPCPIVEGAFSFVKLLSAAVKVKSHDYWWDVSHTLMMHKSLQAMAKKGVGKWNVRAVLFPLVAGRRSCLLWAQEASPSWSTSWAQDASTFYSQPTIMTLSSIHRDISRIVYTCLSISSFDLTDVSKRTMSLLSKAMLND